jgi:hypothetical protein
MTTGDGVEPRLERFYSFYPRPLGRSPVAELGGAVEVRDRARHQRRGSNRDGDPGGEIGS